MLSKKLRGSSRRSLLVLIRLAVLSQPRPEFLLALQTRTSPGAPFLPVPRPSPSVRPPTWLSLLSSSASSWPRSKTSCKLSARPTKKTGASARRRMSLASASMPSFKLYVLSELPPMLLCNYWAGVGHGTRADYPHGKTGNDLIEDFPLNNGPQNNTSPPERAKIRDVCPVLNTWPIA